LGYVRAIDEELQRSNDQGRGFRKYICSAAPAGIDSQGRICVPEICMSHARLEVGDQVNILGVGLWYEVWKEDKLIKFLEENFHTEPSP
jgi:DNA-binding transcriptional regulator/RsmH inhibitor MraZ